MFSIDVPDIDVPQPDSQKLLPIDKFLNKEKEGREEGRTTLMRNLCKEH